MHSAQKWTPRIEGSLAPILFRANAASTEVLYGIFPHFDLLRMDIYESSQRGVTKEGVSSRVSNAGVRRRTHADAVRLDCNISLHDDTVTVELGSVRG